LHVHGSLPTRRDRRAARAPGPDPGSARCRGGAELGADGAARAARSGAPPGQDNTPRAGGDEEHEQPG